MASLDGGEMREFFPSGARPAAPALLLAGRASAMEAGALVRARRIAEENGMDWQDIDYVKDGTTAIIALNRPEKLNAVRMRSLDELVAALDDADADDAIRAVVVTGNGRAFCAGTDLSDGFDLPMGGDPATGDGVPPDAGGRVTLRLYEMTKPVIAAVNGPAVGFGATSLLAMDFRLAAAEAKFCYIFARRGIVAESCSSWFLPRIVGVATALDWMLTGRMVPAQEALQKGRVQDVVPAEALLPRAMEIARGIAETTAPVSVAINRQLMWKMLDAEHPRMAHALESRGVAATLAGPDAREGARAFAERRAPAFTSKASDAAFMRAWWS
jgi:enoyl-CoA hydratase/carnithine racemase